MNDQPSSTSGTTGTTGDPASGTYSSRIYGPPNSTFSLHGPAPAVGYLDIVEGFCIATRVRPNWVHRLAMRAVFGWKWRQA